MLRTKDLNLAQTIDLCRSAEITCKEVQAMKTQTEKIIVNALRKMPQQSSRSLKEDNQHKQRSPHQIPRQDDRPGQIKYRANNQERMNRSVPDVGITMEVIVETVQPVGSNAKSVQIRMCRFRRFDKKVHNVTTHPKYNSDDEFFLDSVVKCLNMEVSRTNSEAWFELVTVFKSRIRKKIDSGADTNTIFFENMEENQRQTTAHTINSSFEGTW